MEEDVVFALLLQMSVIFGLKVSIFRDLFVYSLSNASIPFLNGIYIIGKPTIKNVEEILTYINSFYEESFSFHIFPSSFKYFFNITNENNLLETLESKFPSIDKTILMMNTSKQILPETSLCYPFTCILVDSKQHIIDFVKVMSESYHFKESEYHQEKYKNVFSIPYNNENIFFTKDNINYQEYIIYDISCNPPEPCCCGRLMRLSPSILSSINELKEIHSNLESISENYYGVFAIGTRKNYQNQGLATYMTKYLVNIAYKNNADGIGLHASEEAVGIYEKLNFRIIGTQWSISNIK